jgi:hypothetical protein
VYAEPEKLGDITETPAVIKEPANVYPVKADPENPVEAVNVVPLTVVPWKVPPVKAPPLKPAANIVPESDIPEK